MRFLVLGGGSSPLLAESAEQRNIAMPDSWDFSNQSDSRATEPVGTPPVLLTWAMVGLCVVLTLLWWTSAGNPTMRSVAEMLTPPADTIWEGRYHSLFTTVFIHGTLMHLGFNMLWLLRLGAILEQTLNPLIWAAFFILSAVVGSCAELLVSGHTGIGASGVVYAMFGLMWAGREAVPAWRALATRDNLKWFLGWGILCVALTYLNIMPIANGAHAGGFVFGIAVGWLIVTKRYRALAAGALALLVALNVLSVIWVPWSGTWTGWTAMQAFEEQKYELAIARFKKSMRLGYDKENAWENIARAYENLGNEAAAAEARSHLSGPADSH